MSFQNNIGIGRGSILRLKELLRFGSENRIILTVILSCTIFVMLPF